MNLFVLDKAPVEAARALSDQHLYTSIGQCIAALEDPYYAGQLGQWLLASENNGQWLVEYLRELLNVFNRANNRPYPETELIDFFALNGNNKRATPPPRIMSKKFLLGEGDWGSVVRSYKNYYDYKCRTKELTYTGREKPTWISQ